VSKYRAALSMEELRRHETLLHQTVRFLEKPFANYLSEHVQVKAIVNGDYVKQEQRNSEEQTLGINIIMP